MKERNEKQQIDDLFARKLKDMSLPVSSDGLARLQARMGQPKAETRVVFWGSTTVQRYMAIAACLALVCLFGWLYLSSQTSISTNSNVAAGNEKAATSVQDSIRNEVGKETHVVTTRPIPALQDSNQSTLPALATLAEKSGESVNSREEKQDQRVATQDLRVQKPETHISEPTMISSANDLAPIAKTEEKQILTQPTDEKVAIAQKPAVMAERVLVVTIAEPEALTAARRKAKGSAADDGMDSIDEKPEKETKMATLWQQVKRIKQGEIFASKDAGEEERGLIGRAYSGLKQTLDKDKSIKQ